MFIDLHNQNADQYGFTMEMNMFGDLVSSKCSLLLRPLPCFSTLHTKNWFFACNVEKHGRGLPGYEGIPNVCTVYIVHDCTILVLTIVA